MLGDLVCYLKTACVLILYSSKIWDQSILIMDKKKNQYMLNREQYGASQSL